MPSVILVDDEKLARQALRQLLEEFPDIQLLGEAASANAARELIETERPDAMFLDIQMPGMDGFNLLENLENPPLTVFVTAHTEHAVRAFEVEAVDYLVKPVRPERLRLAVERIASARTPADATQPEGPSLQKRDRICLRTPGRTVVATLGEVLALEAEGDFTRVYVRDQAPILICHSIGSYEKELPNPPFYRLDRSHIINLDRITGIQNKSRDETRVLIEGLEKPIRIGRVGWSRLRKSGTLLPPSTSG